MGKLISLSTMREIEVPRAAVGQIVKYTGDMANTSGIGAVIAIRDGHYPSYDVALADGREWCATHLDGSRWELSQQFADAEHLAILRAGCAAKKASDAAAKTSAAEQFKADCARIKAEYRHLIADSSGSCVQAAKNIRIELKRAYPGVKFGVRTEKYSGGNSVTVDWTDGPNSQQVERITNKYKGGSFDGMTDSYDYKSSPWTEVFGEAKYLHCNRLYSDKMLTSVMGRVCRQLGGMDKTPAIEDYRSGRLFMFEQSGGCDVQREINLALQKHTYCIEQRAQQVAA